MPNISGNAYALTTFCPIRNGHKEGMANCSLLRKKLQDLPENEDSPLAKVDNTYLARFYILDDAIFGDYPAKLDKLQSKYLVFTANLHSDLDTYLTGMWNSINDVIKHIWADCVGFEKVDSAASFVAYIKECQVTTTYFFLMGLQTSHIAGAIEIPVFKAGVFEICFCPPGGSGRTAITGL